jgi:uncharacterized protein
MVWPYSIEPTLFSSIDISNSPRRNSMPKPSRVNLTVPGTMLSVLRRWIAHRSTVESFTLPATQSLHRDCSRIDGHAGTVARPEAEITFAAELALFLRPGHRPGRTVRAGCDGVSTLGHLVESLGVPLTEVGAVTVNGNPVSPSYRPAGGDVVTVAAMQRPQAVEAARFVLDVHLGTLARRLRLLGVDTAYANDLDDDALIEQANAERRVLLTQDRGLLRRRKLWRGAYVRGARPDEQLADVLGRFVPPLAPWTRCTACNGILSTARKADVERLLMPGTRRTYQNFSRCERCGRVYWRGAHSSKLEAVVESAFRTH